MVAKTSILPNMILMATTNGRIVLEKVVWMKAMALRLTAQEMSISLVNLKEAMSISVAVKF